MLESQSRWTDQRPWPSASVVGFYVRVYSRPFAVLPFSFALPTEPFWFLLLDERFGAKPEIIALVAAFDDVSKIG